MGDGGVVTVSGGLPKFDTYTVTLPASRDRITAIRLEALPDEALAGNGIARAGYYFILSELEVGVRQGAAGIQPVKLSGVTVAGEDDGYPGMAAIDGRPETGWAQVYGGGGLRTAVFRLAEPLKGGPDTQLVVRIRHETRPRLAIGKFRLSLAGLDGADLGAQALPDRVLTAIRKPADQRTPAERAEIAAQYRKLAPELAEQNDRLARLEGERTLLLGQIPHTLISEATEPRPIRVLPRGNWMDDSGEIVQPGAPQFLRPPVQPGRATRRDLADWLVSPENPLTARVLVNRLWKLYFGIALAKNVDDFGVQGEPPVHPELLDWLATELVRSGWDIKHMVRLMVTS
ncbi:MAG TPA: DUF1553 domain-containing protein, partial [Armatimonadota bacterium]|nr:DUF1553 domain-containing protein [Armatimonadota bacterium]